MTFYPKIVSIGKLGQTQNWTNTRKDHISEDHITGTECIFKRIRVWLSEEHFSYWESVFREDLFLYNSSLAALLAQDEGDLLLLVGRVDPLLVDVVDQRVAVEAARRLLLTPVRRAHRSLEMTKSFHCPDIYIILGQCSENSFFTVGVRRSKELKEAKSKARYNPKCHERPDKDDLKARKSQK